MTKEEAIKRIRAMITYMETLDADEEELKDTEAYRMAIEALEQESVLDKIRAKIEEERDAYGKWSETEHWYAYDECLDIIDRYMEE